MIGDVEVIYLNKDLPAPRPATDWSAAFDLYANIKEPITIRPGECETIGTGMRISMNDPELCAIQIPRSGLGSNHGIVLGNLVGLIDPDFQGEMKIPVWNRNPNVKWERIGTDVQLPCYNREGEFVINPGDRIVQLMFVRHARPILRVVEEFSTTTQRGDGGFGHSGGSSLLTE